MKRHFILVSILLGVIISNAVGANITIVLAAGETYSLIVEADPMSDLELINLLEFIPSYSNIDCCLLSQTPSEQSLHFSFQVIHRNSSEQIRYRRVYFCSISSPSQTEILDTIIKQITAYVKIAGQEIPPRGIFLRNIQLEPFAVHNP